VAKILLVEDDSELCQKVVEWLKHDFHTVEFVNDGDAASDRILNYHYDLIILDWELPFVTGPELCRRYRAKGGSGPVLMLTGKSQISDKETGFLSGADDYLTKPFIFRELSMRVQALLRRASGSLSVSTLEFLGITLNSQTHEVLKNGLPVDLAPKEFALLELFMKHPNDVFSPDNLLDRLWKSESDASVDTLRTTIKNLRKKISDGEDSLIKTVHRVGYKLNADR
jgi:two-component system, OmpR family, response regulator